MDIWGKAKGVAEGIASKYLDGLKKKAIIVGAGFVLFMIIITGAFGAGGAGGNEEASTESNSDGMYSATTTPGGTTPGGTTSASISVNKTNISRSNFIKCIEEYKDEEGYYTRFAQYAGLMYDICTSKNINPILCAAQAGNESNFGKSVPKNSPWNYWGIGVHNDTNVGEEFDSINDAITRYCDLILGYQKSGSIAYEKAQKFAPYNSKITGNMNSIYDIYCAYAYLGDYHKGTIWKEDNGHIVNAKEYLVDYMGFNCTHNLEDATTMEERAAYAVDYVDNHIIRVAENIFGKENLKADTNTIVGERIDVQITGEVGGTYTKGNFGHSYVLGKFHSNITGLDHYIVDQTHDDIGWGGKCNRGAAFAVLSAYKPSPFTKEFMYNDLADVFCTGTETKVFTNNGFEAKNISGGTQSNDLKYKYVKEVQSLLPNGGYVVLYIQTDLKDDKTPTKTNNVSCWTMKFHYVAILGYDVVDGKEMIFVGESGWKRNSGWYPIEEFESLDSNGYISNIYTILPK